MLSLTAWAVPADPRPMEYVQPNGDTLIVRLVGDERFHFTTTIDGVLIAKNDKGYYCYAKWTELRPKDFLDLVKEIEEFQASDAAKPTPFASESFPCMKP